MRPVLDRLGPALDAFFLRKDLLLCIFVTWMSLEATPPIYDLMVKGQPYDLPCPK